MPHALKRNNAIEDDDDLQILEEYTKVNHIQFSIIKKKYFNVTNLATNSTSNNENHS